MIIHETELSTYLVTFIALGMILSVTVAPVAAGISLQQQNDDTPQNYSVVQNGECTTITSFGDGSESVEEFYDYRTPYTQQSSYTYSSFGTTQFQQDNTSVLFFYEGAEGASLVLVHGHLDGDSAGGALTMELEGLPEEGEWVIEDDNYEGQYDEFDHAGTSSRITWAWTENRTDGGVFQGGLGDGFEITVDPAFNDDADFRVYEGNITEWQALSDTGDDIERTALDFQQITILPGACSSFTVSELSAPNEIDSTEEFEVSATVVNDGNAESTFTVPFRVDGEVVEEATTTLEPGEEADVTATMQWTGNGTHTIEAGDRTAEVTIIDPKSPSENGGEGPGNNGQSGGFTYAAAIGALAIAAAFWRRRR
jgi:hypothetical protein